MAKPKTKPKKTTAKAVKVIKAPPIKFVAFTASATHLFAITADSRVYVWNGLEGLFVPNWDVDGSVRASIALQEKMEKEAFLGAVKNPPIERKEKLKAVGADTAAFE